MHCKDLVKHKMALKGATFCISGTLSKGRKDVEAAIAKNGGNAAGSVTGKVTHLLCAPSEFEGKTSKVVTAEAKGIHIVKEDFLWDAIKSRKLPPINKYTFGGAGGGGQSAGGATPTAKAAEPAAGSKRAASPPKKIAPEAPTKRSAAAAAESPAKRSKGGGRPVDPAVPGRDSYCVVDDWSVLLNQTNVGANNNKFYKIQQLKDKGGNHFCFTHWGRVGATGQHKLDPCGSQDAAEREFKKKFRDKTGVPHDNVHTHDWTPTIGKYTLVETDEQEGAEGGENAPLGKLTAQQIEKGQGVLQKLDEALSAKKRDQTKLDNLSSQYYTLIPHDFGFKVPPAISTKEMLESEAELLKFYLRMGFEELEKADDGKTPISGIMAMDLPKSLDAACKGLCGAEDIAGSNERGVTHATKQSGKPAEHMEACLYAAIMLYTSNAIYRDLNNVLRGEDRGKIRKYFAYLRLLLEALNRLPQQSKNVWRGISVDLFDQYKKGSTVTWWSVSSCTSDINVAKNFMKGCGGKCTLLTVKSKTAADISTITFFGNEKEHLLAPGTQLKVLSSERKGDVTEITMEEVGRAIA